MRDGVSKALLSAVFVFLALCVSPSHLIAQPASILYVNRSDPSCSGLTPCFSRIQAAIDAAQPRSTIRIQPGSYPEQLQIQKNDFKGAVEADRIVIESDPDSSPGAVVLTGSPGPQCTNKFAIRLKQSKFITIRGLTITGTGAEAIFMMGGNNDNHGVHVELNRIYGNGSSSCNGGITIARGNPGTIIANNVIYANGRNGIFILDPDGGPHYIINNTIYGNQWNGIHVAREHQVAIVNNIVNGNGTLSGSSGGRFGINRENSPKPQPVGIQLRNNLVCGNTGGEINGPVLDATDSDNLTPQGNEGPGVEANPGCELPGNLFTNRDGADGVADTGDDDFSLHRNSLAIDVGMDPRTLGLDPRFDPSFLADYLQRAIFRPQDGNGDGIAEFDAGAFEFTDKVAAPNVEFLSPEQDAYVRQTITVIAQASHSIGIANMKLAAGNRDLPVSVSPPLPTTSATASALWNTTEFSDGVVVLTATATDSSSKGATATRSVIIDNTSPETEITGGPAGEISLTTASFTFAGTDNLTSSAALLFAWRIDGGAFTPFGTATSATVTGLSEGPHTFEVKARDLAGNEDFTPATRTFSVQVGPVITHVEPESGIIGTLVTINGSGFEPGTTQVAFSGVGAAIRTITATSITTTVPPSAATGLLSVATSGGITTRTFAVNTSQSFNVTFAPPGVQTVQGGSTAVLIDSIADVGFSGLIQLATGPLPTGVNTVFSPPTLAPNNSSVLTVAATNAASLGTHLIEIRATAQIDGQTVNRAGSVTLNIAAPGQTVLVGRVVDADDKPLAGVSIKLGGATLAHLGFTDAAGTFFIPLSNTGPQVFLIDGSTANTATVNYPTVPVTLDIQSAVVNELGYVPRLRGQAVTKLVPIVPGQATVITDADLPGFKMTIPAGVQIIGWDGAPNTQFGVTVVPVDRSPLPPLPSDLEARQTYLFSFGKMGGGTPTGNIPIDTPNDVGGLPGEKIDLYFFNEAPDGTAPNRWEKYGTGTVSSDGTTIVTDVNPDTGLPYGIPRFCCGARTNVRPSFATLGGGPSGGPRDGGKQAGDPVDTATGFFYMNKTDMVLPGRFPIVVTRTYRTNLSNVGPFGIGTSWPFDISLQLPPDASTDTFILVSPGNRQDFFSRQPDGTYLNLASPSLHGAVLRQDGSEWVLRFKDGTVWRFEFSGRIIRKSDRNGNSISISREVLTRRVLAIAETSGRALAVNYTDAGIESISDPIGRQIRYSYDALGRLETVTDPAGGVTRYTYDSVGRMASLTDARGITYLSNEYDSSGRVLRQTQADGGVWTFSYTANGSFVSETSVSNPRGHITIYRFNAAGFPTSETNGLGLTTMFERQTGTNLLLSVTDPLKRSARFEYDAAGNVTKIIDPAGNARAFTYEPNFNKLATITDPLGNLTRLEYDAFGNLTAAIDPVGKRTTVAHNSFGQPVSTTDAFGNVTTFAYDGKGNLSSVANPLGQSTHRAYDEVSRLIAQTDPRGKTTKFAYDALNRITAITDPLGGVTQFGYDGNSNLLAVIDARGNTTQYTYDGMDRLATRTDPLGAVESFEYDVLGNLIRHIDRKVQSSSFAYDALDRRIRGSYGDGTSADFLYDAAGRMAQATDSLGGTIANQYDTLDRLVAQITNLGTVSYQYDALGRRTSMNSPGQSLVTYGYDAASRLRQVAQGSQIVDLDYDALGRRTRLTLPNGVSTEYQYDAASQLTALIYRNTAGLLGDLTYQYDRAGNRTAVGGSFARTLLPDPVHLATYNAANRQLQFGDKTMAFDPNGNLNSISDLSGITNLTWDARNRLKGISGPNISALYDYDVLGRRIGRTLKSERFEYQYDGVNTVQEFSEGAVLANILSGLGIDEIFTRTEIESATTNSFLADAIGSSLALLNVSGLVQTEYSYEAFGNTSRSGLPNTNTFQFTGRENDSTGVYYYRARYYHPRLQRFISEDPIGLFAGDTNFYAYAFNRPTRWTDPLGLDPLPPCVRSAISLLTCFLHETGQVGVTFNMGAGIGVSGAIRISSTGITGYVGAGVGIGFGVSITGGIVIGESSGVSITPSISGGAGVGAEVQGSYSRAGTSADAGVGFGLGFGATITGGYEGTIVRF